MTKTPNRVPATRSKSRSLAAALTMSGAVVMLNAPAYADTAATAPATQSDTGAPPAAQAFQTAPTMSKSTPAPVSAPPQGVADVAVKQAVSAPASGSAKSEDPIWVLDTNTRPWPLQYPELVPLNSLYFTLPTEREARIMLPGYAADAADRAKFTVSRYVTDNIGSAVLVRGRQLEVFNVWAENTARQKKLLPPDPWAAYQFNKEALETLKPFKEKVQGQSEPTAQRMAADIQDAVAKITPVMDSMSTYEQKLQWYNVLVQLKEGIGMYQGRVTEADSLILAAIAVFERDNPVVARPAGNPPANPQLARRAPAVAQPAANVSLTPEVERQVAQPPAQKQPTSSAAGSLVIALLGAAILGLFWRLRKRIAKKGLKTEKSSD